MKKGNEQKKEGGDCATLQGDPLWEKKNKWELFHNLAAGNRGLAKETEETAQGELI